MAKPKTARAADSAQTPSSSFVDTDSTSAHGVGGPPGPRETVLSAVDREHLEFAIAYFRAAYDAREGLAEVIAATATATAVGDRQTLWGLQKATGVLLDYQAQMLNDVDVMLEQVAVHAGIDYARSKAGRS